MIGFIGCGNMGSALIEGILSRNIVSPQDIVIYDKDTEKTSSLCSRWELQEAEDLSSVCLKAEKIFLGVKPQEMKELLNQIKPSIKSSHVLISVAAGLTTGFFKEHLHNESLKIIRAMPNTPSLVGEGMIAISPVQEVSKEEEQEIISLLEAVGKVVSLKEEFMDAVTGLSGSGPAYVLTLIESLADGGVEAGLSRETALLLAGQTVLGTAKMLMQSQEHPAVLKNNITSPGGTTSTGLFSLEKGNFRATLIEAVKEAAQKSKSMGS